MKVKELERLLRRLHPDAEIRLLINGVGEQIEDIEVNQHCAYIRYEGCDTHVESTPVGGTNIRIGRLIQ
jgi:hypothetical protein